MQKRGPQFPPIFLSNHIVHQLLDVLLDGAIVVCADLRPVLPRKEKLAVQVVAFGLFAIFALDKFRGMDGGVLFALRGSN